MEAEKVLDLAVREIKKPESSPILQSIFDGITDGILVIDSSFRIVMFNKGMQEFLKASDNIEGYFCYFVCHQNNIPCHDCQAQAAFGNIQPPSRIRTCFRDNLKKQFEIWNFPIRNPDGRVDYMVEYMKDVTEKQGMEKELMATRRLAIIGEVAAKASHEIRNPLNAIAGAAHYLLNEFKDDPKVQKYAGLIGEQVTRLDKVAKDMLESSKPRLMIKEKTLINKSLLKSVEVVEEEAAKKKIDIQLYLQEDLPHISFDGERMQQVFINVLRNACEAITGEGTIEITGSLRQINGEDYVELNFMDNGEGIDTQDKEKVFDPFFTTKKEGTGLGLAIVKEIMKSHSGYVFMESGRFGGTCVRIGLPV
jgi:PAS domain S-box-containing protein